MDKILVIGDVHGRRDWKYSVDKLRGQYDKIVFLGDYVDSFFIPDGEIINNLEEIIKFKSENIENTTLLWGNHETQLDYINGCPFNCSGFRRSYAPALKSIFKYNEHLFCAAKIIDDKLFTHAGITQKWAADNNLTKENAERKINNMFLRRDSALWSISQYRGGYDYTGSPFWADWEELIEDPWGEFQQHVGHTQVSNFLKVKNCYNHDFIPEDTYKIV